MHPRFQIETLKKAHTKLQMCTVDGPSIGWMVLCRYANSLIAALVSQSGLQLGSRKFLEEEDVHSLGQKDQSVVLGEQLEEATKKQ